MKTTTPPHTAGPELHRGAMVTLAEQLAQWHAARIQAGDLVSGARLSSVREAARRHGLSPSTVVAAYDLLQAQGLVEARAQRGFFVRDGAAPVASPSPPAPARRAPPLDAAALVRSMFEHQGDRAPSPGMGTLPADWLDLPLLHGALRRAMAEDVREAQSVRYGDPAGDARLRVALSRRLATLGINADATQIVTTAGATAALDLVSRLLLLPGDSVLVDEPGWPLEFARLGQMGVTCLPVPRAADGPDREALRQILESRRGPAAPRAYVTVSVLHNPTGATITLAAAHELLRIAEAHDLTIVEDDTYAWLAPTQSPRLAALDQLRRTVYISGFSKILTPNWRVGFLAASPALVDRAIERKLLTTLSAPGLAERALAIALEQGTLRRHAERLIQRLDAARTRAVRLAREAGFAFAAPPQGLFGWLDAGVDADLLAGHMHREGWLLAPGSLFHAAPRATTLMRINFATTTEPRIWRALREARTACGKLAGTPGVPPTHAGAASKRNGAYHRVAPPQSHVS